MEVRWQSNERNKQNQNGWVRQFSPHMFLLINIAKIADTRLETIYCVINFWNCSLIFFGIFRYYVTALTARHHTLLDSSFAVTRLAPSSVAPFSFLSAARASAGVL